MKIIIKDPQVNQKLNLKVSKKKLLHQIPIRMINSSKTLMNNLIRTIEDSLFQIKNNNKILNRVQKTMNLMNWKIIRIIKIMLTNIYKILKNAKNVKGNSQVTVLINMKKFAKEKKINK